MKKFLLVLALLLGAIAPADAASRFWVGGAGTWDGADTTHWSATSGGAGGQSVPGSSDTATFDGSSGGGTVTVNTTVTIQSLTCGAFTGTLDFSANNNNVTLSAAGGFNCSGTGTRTLNLGNGTYTLSSATATWTTATTTNLTFNANSSAIVFSDVSSTQTRTFSGGGLTYNTVTIGSNTSGGVFSIPTAVTITTLNLTAPSNIIFTNTITYTITNAFTFTGTSANLLFISSNSSGAVATISVASGTPTLTWAGIRAITFTGGATFSASNSFDLGLNTGITVTPPSGGSSGRIIGG